MILKTLSNSTKTFLKQRNRPIKIILNRNINTLLQLHSTVFHCRVCVCVSAVRNSCANTTDSYAYVFLDNVSCDRRNSNSSMFADTYYDCFSADRGRCVSSAHEDDCALTKTQDVNVNTSVIYDDYKTVVKRKLTDILAVEIPLSVGCLYSQPLQMSCIMPLSAKSVCYNPQHKKYLSIIVHSLRVLSTYLISSLWNN